MLQFAHHPLSIVLLCWTTLTDFIFFILKWEVLFLSINSLDLFDMEAPVCLVFLNELYVSHGVVFNENKTVLADSLSIWVLSTICLGIWWNWYGLHHIHLEFFSGNDVFNYVREYCVCSMACAWWAFLVHKHNQLDILVSSSSP